MREAVARCLDYFPSMGIEKIIDRVRKLLNQSKSENEHEAAIAAARAQAMMAEYCLTEAMLRVEDTSRKAEPIIDGHSLQKTRKRVAWKLHLACQVGTSLGVKVYTWTTRGFGTKDIETKAFGREGACQAWSYTCEYLFREIDRLAEEAWDREGDAATAVGQNVRSWKNAFRYGAAQTVGHRLLERHTAEQKERVAAVKRSQPTEIDPVARETGRVHDMALAIIEEDEREVDNEYSKWSDSRGMRTSKSIGVTSSRSGFHAGKEAGSRVRLGGGRAALGAGQGVLR